jgi:hypothetical protein
MLCIFNSLFRHLPTRAARGPARKRRKTQTARRGRVQLRLEALEDRLVPSALVVTNPNDPTTLTAGTLRDAVYLANQDAANGTSDTIQFAVVKRGLPSLDSLPAVAGAVSAATAGAGPLGVPSRRRSHDLTSRML